METVIEEQGRCSQKSSEKHAGQTARGGLLVRVIKAINVGCVVVATFWTMACALTAIVAFLIRENWGHRVQRTWARVFLCLMGVRVRVEALENVPRDRGVILAPNHQSNMDVMVLASLPIDFKWVAKTQVTWIPMIGPVLRTMGSYLVRRDQSGHDLNVMKEVEGGLRAGKAVLIFPEGTRTRSGELLPFKKGAFRTAQNAGVDLLPIAILGTYAIAPPGNWVPPRWGHEVTVRIGTPLPAPAGDVAPVMETFRSTLTRLLSGPSA